MKIGDLVKLKKPTTRDFNAVFLVVDTMMFDLDPAKWLKLDGPECFVTSGWTYSDDYEVVSESRR
tara:strand:- start:2405 stop:2599 length:195 start_codon:yes stop_codon:yes gene_type:complete